MAPASVFDEITVDVVLVRDMEALVVADGFDAPEKDGREESVGVVVVDVNVFDAGAPSMKRNPSSVVSQSHHGSRISSHETRKEGEKNILGRTTGFGFLSLFALDGIGLEAAEVFAAADDADESYRLRIEDMLNCITHQATTAHEN